MSKKFFFAKFFRKAALLLGVAMISAVGLAGFYKESLPDSCFTADPGSLSFPSFFPVTAERSGAKAALSQVSDPAEFTLMLFDVIPVKTVSATTVERPYLVPGGMPFGIKLLTDGVMVIDLTDVGGSCPAGSSGIKEGDIIVSINGENIRSNADAANVIKNSKGSTCDVSFIRDGIPMETELEPVYSEGAYRAGMWIRDSSAGIGTVTFYDPSTGFFGGLGHGVCDSDTHELLPLSSGAVGDIRITGIRKSQRNDPGQLLGEFASSESLGEIDINCKSGVYGFLNAPPSDRQAIPMAFSHEVKKGRAEILCSLDGGEPKSYSIEIERIDLSDNAEHDMVIHVTDKRLISQTGGIVQGMSGSPIIQDGKLVGAVTHVFIEDPERGYAIFADQMVFNSPTH
ncbi:MAG: SpoIVB peptidase [Ruminococcus sp.]|nr:SpoIVB peptidase [Ruminococcus sp.]